MDAGIADRIRGALYGQAIGDALGVATEFTSKREMAVQYPHGVSDYPEPVDVPERWWKRGEWTDDTSQMLCVLDSLLEQGGVNPQDVGRRLFDWMVSDGRGIGGLTALVLRFPGYLADPQTAARTVWEATGHNSAPNGAVMRTSVLGVWNCLSQKQVARNAEQGCLVTHADPRCVASCVAVSLAIRTAVMGQADVEAAVDEAGARAAEYDSEARSVVESSSRDLALMKLDEGLNAGEANRIGYTYKTVGAGFWAFRTASSFIQGISDVITQGGDTDTNAAVAGAMMGARLGLSGIPARLVEGLADRTLLEQKIQALLAAVEPQLLTDR